MNPPTLTKLVDRMVGKSLVQRAADPEDSRRVLVYATDAGLELLQQLQSRIDQHHAALGALLGERNARQLERLLALLIDGVGAPGRLTAPRQPTPASRGRPRQRASSDGGCRRCQSVTRWNARPTRQISGLAEVPADELHARPAGPSR